MRGHGCTRPVLDLNPLFVDLDVLLFRSGDFQRTRGRFGSPDNQDPSILGSVFGRPVFGNPILVPVAGVTKGCSLLPLAALSFARCALEEK